MDLKKDKQCEDHDFVEEHLGSATSVALDGRSEIKGYRTELKSADEEDTYKSEDITTRGAPWGIEPSLKAKCEEVGVDFDRFIDGLRDSKNDEEIGEELGISAGVIGGLRYQFEKYGVTNVEGQD